jgi:uncharacterized protein with PQ loop repeat
MYKNTEEFPHPDSFKRRLDKAMYVIGVVGPLALLPQVVEVFISHDVSSLSIWTWLPLGIINVIWMLYGWLHKENVVLLANTITAVMNFAVVTAIILYGAHP